jgi:hypothetical protein
MIFVGVFLNFYENFLGIPIFEDYKKVRKIYGLHKSDCFMIIVGYVVFDFYGIFEDYKKEHKFFGC